MANENENEYGKYSVVEFSPMPDEKFEKYVVVPNSWIIMRTTMSLVVAYPNEDLVNTRSRIESKQNYSTEWEWFRAFEIHVSDSLVGAYNWMEMANNFEMKAKDLERKGRNLEKTINNILEKAVSNIQMENGHGPIGSKCSNKKPPSMHPLQHSDLFESLPLTVRRLPTSPSPNNAFCSQPTNSPLLEIVGSSDRRSSHAALTSTQSPLLNASAGAVKAAQSQSTLEKETRSLKTTGINKKQSLGMKRSLPPEFKIEKPSSTGINKKQSLGMKRSLPPEFKIEKPSSTIVKKAKSANQKCTNNKKQFPGTTEELCSIEETAGANSMSTTTSSQNYTVEILKKLSTKLEITVEKICPQSSMKNMPPKQNFPSITKQIEIDSKQIKNMDVKPETLSPQLETTKQCNSNHDIQINNNRIKKYETGVMNNTRKVNCNSNKEDSLAKQEQKSMAPRDNQVTPHNVLLSNNLKPNSEESIQMSTQEDSRRRKYMIGKNCNSNLKAATFSMYVSKLDISMTEKHVEDHFSSKRIPVLEVTLLTSPQASACKTNFKSFKITLQEVYREKVFSAYFWPNGAVFGEFVQHSQKNCE